MSERVPETAAAEAWDMELLRRDLQHTQFRHLHHFTSIASTNTFALAQAAAGSPSGSVYFADEQTAGRGRGSHAWHSAPGEGLYVSALVRPALSASAALWISLAAGLAVHEAVRECTGLIADIRWPNDLLLGPKKFCGILTETALDGGALRHAVIGIGINVAHRSFPPELEPIATSLALSSGHAPPRQPLLTRLLRSLDAELSALQADPRGSALVDRLRGASTWVEGKRVHVPEDGGYEGTTCGLDERGFLRVRTGDGKVKTVLTGGVRAIES